MSAFPLTLPLLRNGPLPLPLRGRGVIKQALAPLAGRGRGPARQGWEGEGSSRHIP